MYSVYAKLARGFVKYRGRTQNKYMLLMTKIVNTITWFYVKYILHLCVHRWPWKFELKILENVHDNFVSILRASFSMWYCTATCTHHYQLCIIQMRVAASSDNMWYWYLDTRLVNHMSHGPLIRLRRCARANRCLVGLDVVTLAVGWSVIFSPHPPTTPYPNKTNYRPPRGCARE